MKKALLIIDVQTSAVTKTEIADKIEKLQNQYNYIFVSKFTNQNSPVLTILNWAGYDNEDLAFTPCENGLFLPRTVIRHIYLK